MIIPAFVIGPKDPQGRNFGYLSDYARLTELPPRHQVVAFDMPLALASWAGGGEESCVACVPLTDEPAPLLLMRVKSFGRTDVGLKVFANAVLVDAATVAALGGAVERLLPILPEPDGTAAFGASALSTDAAATAIAPMNMGEFGLEWHDRYLVPRSGRSSESQLVEALNSVQPAVQRNRVRGWTNSGAWTVTGAFDPDRAFQLVVGPATLASTQGRALWFAEPSAGSSARLGRPASFEKWLTLRDMLSRQPGLALQGAELPTWLDWQWGYGTSSPAAMASAVVAAAAGVMRGDGIIGLISLLLQSGDDDFVPAARERFWELVNMAQRADGSAAHDPQLAAWYMEEIAKQGAAILAKLLVGPVQQQTIAALPFLLPDTLAQWLQVGLRAAMAGGDGRDAMVSSLADMAVLHLASDAHAAKDGETLALLVGRMEAMARHGDAKLAEGFCAVLDGALAGGRTLKVDDQTVMRIVTMASRKAPDQLARLSATLIRPRLKPGGGLFAALAAVNAIQAAGQVPTNNKGTRQ